MFKRDYDGIRAYFLQYLVAFVLILILAFSLKCKGTDTGKTVQDYNDHWSVSMDGKTEEYEVLPIVISGDSGEICLKKRLGEDIDTTNCAISFYSSHYTVSVEIDGKEVYRYAPIGMGKMKSSGSALHVVTICEEYLGKELVVKLVYPFPNVRFKCPSFAIGEPSNLVADFTDKRVFPFMVSVLMIMIGILLIISYLATLKSLHLERRLVWLGFLAIGIGMWSLCETQMLIVLSKYKLFASYLTYITIKFTYTPIVGFYVETFHKESKFLKYTCYFNALDLLITCSLQLLGIADLKQTLWVTHSYFLIGDIYLLLHLIWNQIKKYRESKQDERPRLVLNINTFGIILVCVCIGLDFIRYFKRTAGYDSATFSRIGILIYIVILGIGMVKESFRLVKIEREAELLKEAALQDAVTRLGNRNAFQNDVMAIDKKDYPSYGIIMCDLNGLKYINDHYGHSMGDSYIIIAAELVCDTFLTYGNIYRVGGDEFLVLAKNLPENDFFDLYHSMSKKMEELSKFYFDERMGVACGYAIFDPSEDRSIADTEKRADGRMYEIKRQMKKKDSRFRRYSEEEDDF